jgi:hypothetical protein
MLPNHDKTAVVAMIPGLSNRNIIPDNNSLS